MRSATAGEGGGAAWAGALAGRRCWSSQEPTLAALSIISGVAGCFPSSALPPFRNTSARATQSSATSRGPRPRAMSSWTDCFTCPVAARPPTIGRSMPRSSRASVSLWLIMRSEGVVLSASMAAYFTARVSLSIRSTGRRVLGASSRGTLDR
ncbi:MAG: hypothetical protein IT372_17050, partial [Polyangiaceae bacterium]|nr:hypothetical protein [Polyangiaceae bacterium]